MKRVFFPIGGVVLGYTLFFTALLIGTWLGPQVREKYNWGVGDAKMIGFFVGFFVGSVMLFATLRIGKMIIARMQDQTNSEVKVKR